MAAPWREQFPTAGTPCFCNITRIRTRCEEIAEELHARGATAHLVSADFAADPDAAARAIATEIGAHTDYLNVLINNAGGIIERRTVEDADYEIVAGTINLNLVAPMMLATHVSPLLTSAVDQFGRADVINITSIAARSGSPHVNAVRRGQSGAGKLHARIRKGSRPGYSGQFRFAWRYRHAISPRNNARRADGTLAGGNPGWAPRKAGRYRRRGGVYPCQ